MASIAGTMASAPGWPPSPMASSTTKITTSPADGTDAAPIEASSAVMTATACAPSDRSNPMAWAMNSAPTHSKIAVPSMFTVAPVGRTNDEIRFEIPTRCSAVRIVTGSVAAAELVENASIPGWDRVFILSCPAPGGVRTSRS